MKEETWAVFLCGFIVPLIQQPGKGRSLLQATPQALEGRSFPPAEAAAACCTGSKPRLWQGLGLCASVELCLQTCKQTAPDGKRQTERETELPERQMRRHLGR